MKRIISLLLVLAVALSLAACGAEKENEQPETNVQNEVQETSAQEETVQQTEAPQETEAAQAPRTDAFVFNYNGIEIAMNANAADILAQLGEPRSYTEEASCAFVGLDKTYFYGSFYLQTYPVGEEDFVYCVWLVDDSVTTKEGIYIGAAQEEVENAYGAAGYNGSNAYIIVAGDSKLTVILDNDVVSSIQYDAVVD